ncbi:unnamed protein product [Dicrocoelium dendriticum]|nr:unnamed protein product [Dicrocoelium dendriticum]
MPPLDDVDVEVVQEELSYEEKLKFAIPIAQPIASEKLTSRLYKLARKAKRCKKADCGIKSIIKAIEKKKTMGIVVLAADVSPMDSITHLPIICEENRIPYCYVPSRMDLGASISSTTPVPALMLVRDEQYAKLYDKCHSVVDALPLPI